MTDTSAQSGAAGTRVTRLLSARPVQSWQAVLAATVTVLLAGVASLVVLGEDAASADTFVTSVTRGEIELPDGSAVPATIGARVPDGATVRTGRAGGARLTTAGRDVYVGELSTVRVIDGVQQSLERGLVMIDTRSGPELSLATASGAGTVSAPVGSLSRVEQSPATLRLAVYDGRASVTAAGRRATTTVPALRQVRVPYGGLPQSTTALALTVTGGVYDTWEQRLAANLVQADIDLNSFATGLNGTDGLAVLSAAPVSLRASALRGRTRGEQALAVAIAQKARLHRDVRANLAEVVRDRGDGGSWGVVAALVQAAVTDVTSVLGRSLDDPGAEQPGVLAGGQEGAASTPGAPGPARAGQPSRGPGGGPSPRDDDGRRPTDRPSPPPPSPTDPVEEAVEEVTRLLPTPTPTPAPSSSSGSVVDAVTDLLKAPQRG